MSQSTAWRVPALAGISLLLAAAPATAQSATPGVAPSEQSLPGQLLDKAVDASAIDIVSRARAECLGNLPPVQDSQAGTTRPAQTCSELLLMHRILLTDGRYGEMARPTLEKRARNPGLEGIYAVEELAIIAATAGDQRSLAAFDDSLSRRAAFPQDGAGLRDATLRAARAALDFADFDRADSWTERVRVDASATRLERAESLLILARIARFRDNRDVAARYLSALLRMKGVPPGPMMAAGALQARLAADELDLQGTMLGFVAMLKPVATGAFNMENPTLEDYISMMEGVASFSEIVDSLAELLVLARTTGNMTASDQKGLVALVDTFDSDPTMRALFRPGWKAPFLIRTALALVDDGLGDDIIAICRKASQNLLDAPLIVQRTHAKGLARCKAQVSRFSGDLSGAAAQIRQLLNHEPAHSALRIDMLREAALIVSDQGRHKEAAAYADEATRAVEEQLRQQRLSPSAAQRYQTIFLTNMALNWKAAH